MLIEMHTLREMVDTLVLPAAFNYASKLAEGASQAKAEYVRATHGPGTGPPIAPPPIGPSRKHLGRLISRLLISFIRPREGEERSPRGRSQGTCRTPSKELPVTLPGFDIDPQIAKAHGLGQLIMEIHITLGNVILWVAGVHAAAALFHRFCLRDEVFQSMTPGG